MKHVQEKEIITFSMKFPSVEKVTVHENGCVYMYLKKGNHVGVPDGFFNGLRSKFRLMIYRYDTLDNKPRLTFQ